MSALQLPSFEETVRYGRPEIDPLTRPSRRRRLRLVPPPEPLAAITFDQALGSSNNNATGSNTNSPLNITTGAVAAAASRIIVCVSWFDSATGTFTVADSGGSYTKDKQFDNGSDHFAIFSRVLVGSLASGSAIGVSWTTGFSGGGVLAGACSYLGTTGVDTTATNATTGTGFSSGSAINSVANALFVGGAGNETATSAVGGTNTNGTQRFDIWNNPAGQGMRMLDLIASSSASQALTGTWAVTSTATTGALVVYSGTGSVSVIRPFTPQRFPMGV